MLPELNDLVILVDDDENEYRSRVEGIDQGLITVGRPLDLLAATPFEVGDELLLTWPDGRGVGVVRTRLVELPREAHLRFWSLEVIGRPWRQQRREYVRASAVGSVRLIPCRTPGEPLDDNADRSPDEAPPATEGRLIDVSEAAVRVRLARGAEVAGFGPVIASFAIEGHDFELPGTLTQSAAGATATGDEVIVVFAQPVGAAEELRRLVFELERRSLRSN
jgi:hypothetical protein